MKPLTEAQRAALARLAADERAFVEAGTLAFLRRGGLVGKLILNKGIKGEQRTVSPVTDAGRLLLRALAQ